MSQENAMHEDIEDLRADLEAAKLREAEEHQTRLKYQGLVYVVCAELDHALGRHVSMGTGTLADEDSLLKAIRQLTQERDTALSDAERAQFAAIDLYAGGAMTREHARTAMARAHPDSLTGQVYKAILPSSAALAERDRAIEKRTAERCAEIAHSMCPRAGAERKSRESSTWNQNKNTP